ncbi:ATP-binding protein [Aequorivita capsosiphonis]|uniref:ATP-binding protein n=1 Tax=Aequorivita capsosiphonis TaxID=487317 RepID=UPI0004124610|nr:ATP-binding protein [Aequorivita capsosiphonis]
MNKEDIDQLIDELQALPRESEWVEFKGDNWNPDKLGSNISALSNAALLEGKRYGYIVYGIEDKTHAIKGTNFDPDKVKIKGQEIENYIATQLQPRTTFNIIKHKVEDLDIVIFQINTPIGHPLRYKGIAYIRVGSYTKELKDHADKEARLWRKLNKEVFEKTLATSYMNPTDVIEKIAFIQVFKMLGIPLPESREAILEKLVEEKLIHLKLKKYAVTNLGAILFANDLNEFPEISRKVPRVIIYKGKDKLVTIKEQEGKKGYATGFKGLINYINDQLPSNEEIGRVFRKEVKMYPELAIRELVANAIIHQDFSIKGTGVMIEIYSDRIEITNPGKPMIDTNRFIDHSPESRNEALARFMRRLKICEERGSGIDKVISQVETYQLPAPEFIEGDNYTRVKMFSTKSLRQMTKKDKVRATYQHCVLKYLSNEYMSNSSLRLRFGIDDKNYPQASRIIKQAIVDGLIAEYENSKTYIPYWAQ